MGAAANFGSRAKKDKIAKTETKESGNAAKISSTAPVPATSSDAKIKTLKDLPPVKTELEDVRPDAPGFCGRGHKLKPLGTTCDTGWACCGKNEVGGCKSGISGFNQTWGRDRFRCELCDYDLCQQCFARKETKNPLRIEISQASSNPASPKWDRSPWNDAEVSIHPDNRCDSKASNWSTVSRRGCQVSLEGRFDSKALPLESGEPLPTTRSCQTIATSSSQGSEINALRRQKSREQKYINAYRETEEEIAARRLSTSNSCVSITEIDAEAREFLTKVMLSHFLFSSMSKDEYESIFSNLKRLSIDDGQTIFNQGDSGDSCYFVKSGTYDVTIDDNHIRSLSANQSFGELALLYSMPRSATIKCSAAGELWKMDRPRFVRCMDQLSTQNNTKALTFFTSDANFRHLEKDVQKALASCCSVLRFSNKQEILREGENANWMFIIITGKVRHEDNSKMCGSVLGSVNLIYGKPQTTGVVAAGRCICLSLGKHALWDLPVAAIDVFRRNAIKTILMNIVQPIRKSILPSLTNDQLHRLIGRFEEVTLEPKEIIFSPGDDAQLILVIDGEVVICKSQDGSGVEHKLADGMIFGEKELVADHKMSRYMVVIGKARIHRVLHSNIQRSFGEPFADLMRCNEVKRVLQDIFLFKNLKEEQIDHTVRRLQQQRFAANEVVCRQGDPAKHFFLIQKGTILIKKDSTVLRTLGAWDSFGERGLLLHEMRSATCQAVEPCVCLVLDADDFFDIVGMFRKELERRMHLQDLNIRIEDLKCKAVVGRGTFGTVRLVHHHEDERKQYALKGVKKVEVVKGNQQVAIVMEREVNKQCYHPCIMQFIKTFQDADHIYFLTEFLGGGDLFFAIREIGYLSTLHCQFFSGSIVLALEYLHARGIMYRDLKPENVLLDLNGAAKLVDFGCCKKEVRTHTLIGTPDYMAPEVIKQQGYTCSCDWWSLGVMIHEFIVGPLPFGADAMDQMSLFKAILKDPLLFPNHIEDEGAMSLISGLLERKTEKRLGASSHGAKDIKAHEYYSGFNWDALGGGFHEPPWRPNAEALEATWEESDGDIFQLIGSKPTLKATKEMEWAKGF